MADYAMTLADGMREKGRVQLTDTTKAAILLRTPSVLLYGAMKMSKNRRLYQETSVIRAPETCDNEQLKKMANELRKLSDAAL